MNRKVTIAGILLIVLILAGLSRWSVEAQSTSGGAVTKWQKDRWTGDVWLVRYSGIGYSTEMLADLYSRGEATQEINNQARQKRRAYTVAWRILLGLAGTWFTIEALKTTHKKAPA